MCSAGRASLATRRVPYCSSLPPHGPSSLDTVPSYSIHCSRSSLHRRLGCILRHSTVASSSFPSLSQQPHQCSRTVSEWDPWIKCTFRCSVFWCPQLLTDWCLRPSIRTSLGASSSSSTTTQRWWWCISHRIDKKSLTAGRSFLIYSGVLQEKPFSSSLISTEPPR